MHIAKIYMTNKFNKDGHLDHLKDLVSADLDALKAACAIYAHSVMEYQPEEYKVEVYVDIAEIRFDDDPVVGVVGARLFRHRYMPKSRKEMGELRREGA